MLLVVLLSLKPSNTFGGVQVTVAVGDMSIECVYEGQSGEE